MMRISAHVHWHPFGWQEEDVVERFGLESTDLRDLPAERFAEVAAAARAAVREVITAGPSGGWDRFWFAQRVFGLSRLAGLLSADPRAGHTSPAAGRLRLADGVEWTAPGAVFALACEHLAGVARFDDAQVAAALLRGDADLSALPGPRFRALLIATTWMTQRYEDLEPHVARLAWRVDSDLRSRAFTFGDLVRTGSGVGTIVQREELPRRSYVVDVDGDQTWVPAEELEPAGERFFRTASVAFLTTGDGTVDDAGWPAVGPVWSRVDAVGEHRLVQVFFSWGRFYALLAEDPGHDPLEPLAERFAATAAGLGAEAAWIDPWAHFGDADWEAREGSPAVNAAVARRYLDGGVDALVREPSALLWIPLTADWAPDGAREWSVAHDGWLLWAGTGTGRWH